MSIITIRQHNFSPNVLTRKKNLDNLTKEKNLNNLIKKKTFIKGLSYLAKQIIFLVL